MADPAPLLRVNNLRVSAENRGVWQEVVRGVSFSLGRGETLGLVGESGSGKTLTVTAIAGLLPPTVRVAGGAAWFRDEDLLHASPGRLAEIRGKDLGMVFQGSLAALNPVMRVGRQVAEPLRLHGVADAHTALAAAERMLRDLGIPNPTAALRHYPHEFSGGQRQRATIATAMIAAPSLVIADEPTTALDATVQAQILEIWRRLNQEAGVALILVSHDLGVIAEICGAIAVMYAGRIVETAPTEIFLARPRHPYTQALLQSIPSAGASRMQAVPGEPPVAGALPNGCPFHPRCPKATAVCRETEPPLESVGPSAVACWAAGGSAAEVWTLASPVAGPPRPAAAAAPPDDTGQPLLVLDRVTRHHLVPSVWPLLPPARVHAVDEVTVTVSHGEVLGLAGESGCGKSTLARCILRMIDIDSGRIIFRGEDITHLRGEPLRLLRRHLQPVFQDPYDSLNPRARVHDIVAEPLVAHGKDAESRARRVAEVLELVGLSRQFAGRLPMELSGGQRQRVGIARAIVLNPDLIVADEPISALDVSIQAQIVNLFQDLRKAMGLTLIFISHDLRIVRHISTNVAIMFLGQIVEHGPSEAVCERPLHPYTAALLSSVPTLTGVEAKNRIVLEGEPPSPVSPPTNCRFRMRCPYAREICASAMPELRAADDRRLVACHFPGIAGTHSAGAYGIGDTTIVTR
jgi:peptide/nickel transport system ATP-binding protein